MAQSVAASDIKFDDDGDDDAADDDDFAATTMDVVPVQTRG